MVEGEGLGDDEFINSMSILLYLPPHLFTPQNSNEMRSREIHEEDTHESQERRHKKEDTYSEELRAEIQHVIVCGTNSLMSIPCLLAILLYTYVSFFITCCL